MSVSTSYNHITKSLLLLFFFFSCSIAKSASLPESGSKITNSVSVVELVPSFEHKKKSVSFRKQLEKAIGRKLKFKEWIALKLFQYKQKRQQGRSDGNSLERKAKWSVILGVLGIVLVFIPFGLFFSVPSMLLALIFGYRVRQQDPSNKTAKAGIILGWSGIGLLLVAIGIAVTTLM